MKTSSIVMNNDLQDEEKRDIAIDIAKGITILCVIMGHCGLTLVGTFHMPLFMILSGYFMSDKRPMSEFARIRARQLLIPYSFAVFATMLVSALRNLIIGSTDKILPDILKFLFAGIYGKGTKSGGFLLPGIQKTGACWFLLAVFLGGLIVRKFLNSQYMLVIVAIISYIAVTTKPICFLPWSIQPAMFGSLFIGIGFYCRKYNIFYRKFDVSILIAVLALWIFGVWKNIHVSVVNVNAANGLLSVLVVLSGSFCIVKFSQTIERNGKLLKNFLTFCGQNSLIILVWHAVESSVFKWSWLPTGYSIMGFDVARSIVRIVFSILCTALTLKIPPLKKGICKIGKIAVS